MIKVIRWCLLPIYKNFTHTVLCFWCIFVTMSCDHKLEARNNTTFTRNLRKIILENNRFCADKPVDLNNPQLGMISNSVNDWLKVSFLKKKNTFWSLNLILHWFLWNYKQMCQALCHPKEEWLWWVRVIMLEEEQMRTEGITLHILLPHCWNVANKENPAWCKSLSI